MESAIFEDCSNLINQFVEVSDPSFQSFCQQWKLNRFSHVYSAQTTSYEINQTTNAIMYFAKRVVSGTDDMGQHLSKAKSEPKKWEYKLRRMAGIYLLYSVYYKQPASLFVKICVSHNTWKSIISFIESFPDHCKYDVHYVFCRLCKEDAFRFVALDNVVGLEGLVDYDRLDVMTEIDEEEEIVKVKLQNKLATHSDILDRLSEKTALEDNYCAVKSKLKIENPSTGLPQTKIFHNIQSTFKNIQKLLDGQNLQQSHQRTKCTKEGIMMNLKRKPDNTKEDDPLEESTNTRAYRRMSSRSLFKEKLPDHVTNDLDDSDDEDEEEEEEEDQEDEEEEKEEKEEQKEKEEQEEKKN